MSGQQEDYVKAWRTVNRWTDEGRSWSGHERNCSYLSLGDGSFANVSAVSGIDFDDDGRALVTTDWDHDGDIDIWLGNRTTPRVRFMRNGTDLPGRAIAFKLEGTKSNRDAIGARIVATVSDADGAPVLLQRYVTAGEGYLSQSSKWVTIGLGDHHGAVPVTVNWPSGISASWELVPGSRYLLVEGEGEPKAVTPLGSRGDRLALVPGPVSIPQVGPESRLFLAARYPLPELRFESFRGEKVRVPRSRPTLVMLWSTTCPVCLRELAEWGSRIEEFSDLHVVALCTDQITKGGHEGDAQQILRTIGFPAASGWALSEFVGAMQTVHDDLFHLRKPLPLPCSFLIDADGQLAAIYKGAVPFDVVREDVSHLRLTRFDAFAAALPFSGTWLLPPQGIRAATYRAVAEALIGRGEYAAAVEQLRRAVTDNPASSRARTDLANASMLLGETDEAIEQYQESLRLSARQPDAALHLATLLARRRDFAEAEEVLTSLVTHFPEHQEAHARLASLAVMRRDITGATVHAQRVVELSDSPESHRQLAQLLQQQRRYADAVVHFTESLRRADETEVATQLSWLLATCPDDDVRKPELAVQLAERCVARSGAMDAVILDTLAAAQGANGDFDAAVTSATRAATLARQTNEKLAAEIERRLALYRMSQPFRSQ